MRRALVLLLVAVAAIAIGLGAPVIAASLDGRWHTLDGKTLLFIPRSVSGDPTKPVRVIVTLPGLGGAGRDIGDQFSDAAEADRWLLVAPTPSYDPIGSESLESADLRNDDELVALIDKAIARSPAPVSKAIGVVGFSRGAQQGHRFALRHSDRVTALASFSAGTYTMPTSQLPYPIGVGNFEFWDHGHAFDAAGLRRVNVFIGVGSLDENPADVARAWDVVGGTTRVARGAAFARALKELGVTEQFKLYPNTGHAFTNAMRDDAVAELRAN